MKQKILLSCLLLLTFNIYVQAQIKTLLITGQDGSHYWRGASKGIEQILENSKLFNVDILVTHTLSSLLVYIYYSTKFSKSR